MIPLMKNALLHEHEARQALAGFIINAQRFSMGEQCERFETEFARFQGAREAVLFNSGGSANLAMIQALKNRGVLVDGDAVGFSALTWSTNVMPIIQLGLVPVAVDCAPYTLNVMSRTLEQRLQDVDMKALFITNALGFAGDLDRIRAICASRNILLFEDNCEALGTELPEGKTGTFGAMASFSFFVAHHMSTIEGGMVCTDNEEFAEMLRVVRANGWDRNVSVAQQHALREAHNVTSEFDARYTFYDLGYNLRPTEITGFLGLHQLQFLDDNIRMRMKNYIFLEEAVRNNPDFVMLDRTHISVLSSFAFPVVCCAPELRAQYVFRFEKAGVEVRPMIAGNIQNQPFYKKYVEKMFDVPGAQMINDCGFYFGNYPELSEQDLQIIIQCLRK